MSFSFEPVVSFTPDHPSASLPCSITVRLGERLRLLRRDRGYTQTQLADFLGIDRSFLGNLERGKAMIRLPCLEIIAQGFDMTLSELIKDL